MAAFVQNQCYNLNADISSRLSLNWHLESEEDFYPFLLVGSVQGIEFVGSPVAIASEWQPVRLIHCPFSTSSEFAYPDANYSASTASVLTDKNYRSLRLVITIF